jgi:hypothetical protein
LIITNFEKLKNEINIYDFTEDRLTFDKHHNCISNDVIDVFYGGDGKCRTEAFSEAYEDELAWLQAEAKENETSDDKLEFWKSIKNNKKESK